MTDISIAPEPLTKLVSRFTRRDRSSSSTVVIEDLDGENNAYYPVESSSRVNPSTIGDNVNLVERYLLEATRALDNEAKTRWLRFIDRIEKEHYTRSQIKKIIQNLDKKKQYSALHYAIWHNNIYLIQQLLDKKSKFSSDVNILSGNGEHALHIVAQSKSIWITDQIIKEEPPKKVTGGKQAQNGVPITTVRTTNTRIQPELQTFMIPTALELLLPLCKTVDHRDSEERTPLHVAVLLNRPIYIKILLDKGADISAKSILQHNVFHYVSLSSCSPTDKDKMFDILINFPRIDLSLLTTKNLEGLTPFSMAIHSGTIHMIEIILSKINWTHIENDLPICIDMLAKRSTTFPKVFFDRFLFQHYHPDKSSNLLHIICHYNNPDLLKHILDHIQNRTKNLNEYLELTDEHGYTPLLTAVYYGHKPMVELLLERKAKYLHVMTYEKKNLLHLIAQRQHMHLLEKLKELFNPNDFLNLMSCQTFQSTPLHDLCLTNNVQLCRFMLQMYSGDKMKLFQHQNSYGRTIYHQACEAGRLEMIQYLTSNELIKDRQEKIRLLAIGDDERRTGLHLAAAEGHTDVVAYLLQSRLVNINALTDKCETAFHYACTNGHRSVVVELLDYECDTLIRNAQLYNGLELSILNHHEDVARYLLLEYQDWRPMLQNAQIILNANTNVQAYDTPIRKLIRYMPELATDVIDEQFTRTSGAENMTVDKQIYDYEFFEDQLIVKHWYSKNVTSNRNENGALVQCCSCFSYRTEYEPYTGDSYTLVRNHPLFIISESNSQLLMEHPFCQTLRSKKYSQFGRYLLIFSFILYLLYLCAYTSIILRDKHPEYFYALVNESSLTDDRCEAVAYLLTTYNIREAFKDTIFRNLKLGVYVFLVLFIVKNTILISTLFPRVFRKTSYYLEGAALILAFVCVLDTYDWLDPLILRCPTQYQIGAFALLLSWINFLVYVRCIPIVGIYVVMLQVISKKFLRFLPVLLVLIAGFGFTYYALLQNQTVYSTPVLSLIKTSLIMFEMNFDDRIYQPSNGGINYYPMTFIIFILTGYIMTIFVINLLIGLAVGEIPTLVQQGTLLQSRIYYDNLSDYEILRLQIRSLILWVASNLCCCCSSLCKYKFFQLVDQSFLRQRPILFLIYDRKQYNIFQRFGRLIKKKVLNEQIQESIDEEEKERFKKRNKTKDQRAQDEDFREKKELAYLKTKTRTITTEK